MSRYEETVKKNMDRMNLKKSDLHVLEFTIINDVPMFNFPRGYSTPDTSFKSVGSDTVCELCGHKIKNPYYIICDEKKLILMVGSECVGHFEEKSGHELLAEKDLDYKRECFEAFLVLKQALSRLSFRTFIRYGRTERRFVFPYYTHYQKMCDISNIDKENKASLTKWYNKNNAWLVVAFLEYLNEMDI